MLALGGQANAQGRPAQAASAGAPAYTAIRSGNSLSYSFFTTA